VPEARLRRAEALARLGRRDEAEALLRPLLAGGATEVRAAYLLGTSQLERGRAAEALATLDGALRRKSPDASMTPALLFRAAEALEKLGRADEARARYLKVAEGSPKDAWADDALLRAASLALKAGDVPAARKLAEELTARYPDSPLKDDAGRIAADSQFLVARKLIEARRYSEAIGPLKAYLAEQPEGQVADYALAYLAQAQSALGQTDAALEALNQLASRFPRSKSLTPARLSLAEAALAAGQYDRAASLFRQAGDDTDAKLRPRVLSGLGWALLEAGQPAEAAEALARRLTARADDATAPEDALALGRALEAAGKLDDAVDAYARVVKAYPQSDQAGPAALARARLLVKADRAEDAARAFEEWVRDHPKAAGLDAVLAEWGAALLDADRLQDADAVFRRLLDEFPASRHAADARINLAESAYQARQYDAVAELLGPLVAEGAKVEPALVQSALYRLGRTRAEQQDWAGATALFDRLVAEHPDGPLRREAQFWKAEVAFRRGDAKAAEAEFASLVDGPALPEGWVKTARLRRVQCLVALGRWEEALEQTAALKSQVPDHPQMAEIDYARGRALQQKPMPEFDKAREAYQAVIDTRKGGDLAARAQFMRGETYFHEKNYRDAVREYLKVDTFYKTPTWQALALLQAGKASEQLDRWSDAAELYRNLIERFPDEPAAKEAGERLKAAREKGTR
jgi:TolA-binding protein